MIEDTYNFLVNNKITNVDIFSILGSGIIVKELEDSLNKARFFNYAEIPGFPVPTVKGHLGKLTIGTFKKIRVAIFTGRKHLYEGNLDDVLFFPRLAKKLGAEIGIFVCSAGGLDYRLSPGDIVIITDFLNFQGQIGIIENRHYHTFIPISNQVSKRLLEASTVARIYCHKGILASVVGPTYETPAESEMLRRAGATVASMSMVPEISEASRLGIKCGAISIISNVASIPTDHTEVLNLAEKSAQNLNKILIKFLELVCDTI